MDVSKVNNVRELLVRKPFYELTSQGYMKHFSVSDVVSDKYDGNMPEDTMYRRIKTQADFLREFYPSAHRIMDEAEYPDIWKQNPDNDKWYRQKIQRTAFAFQQLIHTKHLLHLTGNDVQFELADGDDYDDEKKADDNQKLLNRFKKGWLMHDMEIRFFEAVSAYLKVAECAIVGFFNEKNEFCTRTLSYNNGDILYPQFDSLTGDLVCFARKYYDYDDEGNEKTEWVEAWDDRMFYRFKRGAKNGKMQEILVKIGKIFGIDDYTLVESKEHGFQEVPVAYARCENGPCWFMVQKNIEDYEEAFSYLCENNKAFAFPILTLTGDGEDISVQGDDATGAAKTIMITDTNGKAEFLNGTDASDAFATQLNKSYDLIYELSFTVKPPELKSGDLPGVAIKLLYSPALEVAMNDAQKLQPFLDKLLRICQFGIGTEEDCVATMVGLPINAWIDPYIHQNKTEQITNIATAVQNGFLSKQTASERCPDFPKTAEYERIMREKKEEDQQDLLMDMQRADNETENKIEEEKATARINKQQGGNDVNTGGGRKAGRPNRSGKKWDENNNNDVDDKNNWKRYNQTH